MIVAIAGRYLQVTFPYDPSLVALIKATDGRIYQPQGKKWLLPLANPATISFIATVARLGMPVSYVGCTQSEIDNVLREMSVARHTLEQAATAEDAEGDAIAYSFQRVGIAFMKSALQLYGGVLNACEPGLGKTIMAILTMKEMNIKTMMIVAPKSVLLQWKSELSVFDPEVVTIVATGPKLKRMEWYQEAKRLADSGRRVALILGYETLRIDHVSVPRVQTLCYDEIHRCGSRSSQISKVAQQFPSEYKIGLSGTPVSNRLPELHSIMQVLSPGFLGSWQQFLERYCTLDWWGSVTGGQNIEELRERIKTIVFRRTIEQVDLQLPPVTYETLPVILSAKERSLYDRVRQELLFELEHSEVSKLSSAMILQNVLVKMGKLLEVCDSLELLGDSKESSKLEILKDHLIDIISADRKVVIFTKFSRMAFILLRELVQYHPVIIVGSKSGDERAEAVKAFMEDPDCRIIICTSAGGEGLNLTSGSVAYNYDLDWSVQKLVQRVGRLVRIKQTQPVLVFNLVTQGTVETQVQKILASKIGLARELLDPQHEITTLDQIKTLLAH